MVPEHAGSQSSASMAARGSATIALVEGHGSLDQATDLMFQDAKVSRLEI